MDLNAKDEEGLTAVMLAVMRGNDKVGAYFLVRSGGLLVLCVLGVAVAGLCCVVVVVDHAA